MYVYIYNIYILIHSNIYNIYIYICVYMYEHTYTVHIICVYNMCIIYIYTHIYIPTPWPSTPPGCWATVDGSSQPGKRDTPPPPPPPPPPIQREHQPLPHQPRTSPSFKRPRWTHFRPASSLALTMCADQAETKCPDGLKAHGSLVCCWCEELLYRLWVRKQHCLA